MKFCIPLIPISRFVFIRAFELRAAVMVACFSQISYLDNYRSKGAFINYLRVPRERGGGVGKISTYSYFGGRGSNPFVRNIFQADIRNRAVKWFGRDHISFI